MPEAGGFVLFEDLLARSEARSRRYQRPAGSVLCSRAEDLAGFFQTIESWRRTGLSVVLLLDYEFGNLLDAAAITHLPGEPACTATALAFESVLIGSTRDVDGWIDQELRARNAEASPAGVAAVQPAITQGQYERHFDQVQQFIRNKLRGQREQILKAAYDEVLRDNAEIHNYYAEQILKSSGTK